MRRIALLATLAALSACGGSDADGPAASGPAAAPAPANPLAAFASRMPDSITHRARACPFECCVYGTWTPTGPVPIRAEPSRSLPAVHSIPAGEAFSADSGFVRITGMSIFTIEDTIDVEVTTFVPGDTVAVLDYVGEGYFNVWDGATVWQVQSFWTMPGPDGAPPVASDGEYAREWWVHATTSDGRKGWLDADSVARLEGADACGG